MSHTGHFGLTNHTPEPLSSVPRVQLSSPSPSPTSALALPRSRPRHRGTDVLTPGRHQDLTVPWFPASIKVLYWWTLTNASASGGLRPRLARDEEIGCPGPKFSTDSRCRQWFCMLVILQWLSPVTFQILGHISRGMSTLRRRKGGRPTVAICWVRAGGARLSPRPHSPAGFCPGLGSWGCVCGEAREKAAPVPVCQDCPLAPPTHPLDS